MPSEPDAPDTAYEKLETRDRVRAAIQSLPWREQKVIGLYYYGEVTMKEIGAQIGVNESRVSQLHARAIRRLRDALGEMGPEQVVELKKALLTFTAKKQMAHAALPAGQQTLVAQPAADASKAVVLAYKPSQKRATPARAGLAAASKPRQAVAAAR